MNQRFSMISKRISMITTLGLAVILILALLPLVATAGAGEILDQQLVEAARAGNAQKVKDLLQKGADANAKNHEGTTALMFAAYQGSQEMIEALIEKGADVNAKDNEGSTALMAASLGGDLSGVEALLEKGADINAQNERGFTSLMWASHDGHIEIVRVLLNKGADAELKNDWGYTASTLAAMKGHTEITALLGDPEGVSSKRAIIGVSSKRAMILGTVKLIVLVILFVLIARMHGTHALPSPFFEGQRWTLNDAYKIVIPLLALHYLIFMIHHQMLTQHGSSMASVYAPIYSVVMYGGCWLFIRNKYDLRAVEFGLDKAKFLTSGVRNANIALAIALLFVICDPGATAAPINSAAKDLNPTLLLHFITFLVVVFAAPVLEELLFRGILYTPVARRIGVWKAMGLVSVVGSLNHLHATEVQTLWLFALFFLLCYGYVRSASLYGPIIWHATLNLVLFRPEVATAFTGFVSGQTLDRYYLCGLFLLLVAVNSLWLAMKSKRVRPNPVN